MTTPQMQRLVVAMPPDMIRRVDTLRSLTGTSRAGFIRLAVADYLRLLGGTTHDARYPTPRKKKNEHQS